MVPPKNDTTTTTTAAAETEMVTSPRIWIDLSEEIPKR